MNIQRREDKILLTDKKRNDTLLVSTRPRGKTGVNLVIFAKGLNDASFRTICLQQFQLQIIITKTTELKFCRQPPCKCKSSAVYLQEFPATTLLQF